MRRLGAGALAVLVAAACNEDFVTGPRSAMSISVRNWSDTLVLGEQRAVRLGVLDADQREVLDARVQWDVASPAVLGSRLNVTGTSGAHLDGVGSRDSVQIRGLQAGRTTATVSLADPRFGTATQNLATTVVVAGVGVASAHDTTLTVLGDTAAVRGTAYARTGDAASAPLGAPLAPISGQGVVWTHRGPGAVTLVGSGAPGDSIRTVATAPGTDTLIATHPFCLRGARCADTTVIHVAPTLQAMGMGAVAMRAWAFGDSVIPRVVVQDARGNAVPGVRLALVPVTAADSAIVGVNTATGVPALSRVSAAPSLVASRSSERTAAVTATATASTPPRRVAVQTVSRPLVMVVAARGQTPGRAPVLRSALAASASPAAASAASAATSVAAPPLVAQANGTARVAVQARLADGTLVGSDTLTVIVRQVANVVRISPAYADLTPGDSIPVHVEANDARGHLIADATFAPAMAGALYRDGRIVVPPNATAGTGVLQALVSGVASPGNNPGAPIPTPPADTARIDVRVPPPMTAGDTTRSAANMLAFTVRDRDGAPMGGTWVRFRIPAGSLQGPDSVQSDVNGAVSLAWTPPTQPGAYTATAVLLSAQTPSDTAGLIVLRRTVVVTSGAASALSIATAPPSTSAMAVALSPAPAVQLVDRLGNAVRQAGVVVTATLPPAAGSTFAWTGTLTATTDADGQARFPALTGSGAAGSYAIQFDAPSLTGAVSRAVQFTVGAAQVGNSTITVSAPSIASGTTATVVVTPRDAYGNAVGAGQTVTVAVPATPATGAATATVSSVADRGDGTYAATLTGVVAGTPFPISATIGGAALAGPTLAVTPGAVARLQLSPAAATLSALGAGAPFTVTAADAAGNSVPTAGVTWTASTPAGAPAIATIDAAGIPTAVANGTATITATLGAISATATLTVQQSAGVLTKQAGDAQTAPVATPVSVAPTVRVHDANGAPVAGVAVQFAVTAGNGAIAGNGTTQVVTTDAGGLATVGSWTLGGTPGANALTATMAGAPAVTFTATAVAGTPGTLAVLTQPPTTAVLGSPLTPAPVVQLTDARGNAVRQAGVVITAALPNGTGAGFAWGGTLTATTDADGRAQFGGITGSGAPGSYALQFTSPALTPVATSAVRFTAGAPQLGQSTITVSAPTIASGTTASVVVTPRDAYGNVVGAGQTVAIALPAAPAPGAATATVSSVVDRGDGTYAATLTGVRAGTSFPIGATIGGAALTGPSLAVTPGTATTLQISPATVTLAALGTGAPFTVSASDAAGNAVPTAGLVWTSSATGIATIGSTGVPTAIGNGTTTITATLGTVSTTATITVQQAVAAMAKLAGDAQTGTVATTLATAPAVRVLDASGAPVAGAAVHFAIGAGGGTISGNSVETVTTASDGIATAGAWALGTVAGAQTLVATMTGAPALTFTATGTAAAAAGLAIATAPPTTSAMAVSLVPAPLVQLVDRFGNIVRQSGVVVSASLPAGVPFTLGGTLAATTDADGQAHFTALSGSGAAGSYAIAFGAPSLTSITSSAVRFTVGTAQVGQSTITISAPSIASGTTATVVVTPRDAYGNAVGAGQIVTVTVPSVPTAGQATATVSAVTDHGDGTYTATLTGVRAGTPLTVNATIGGAALGGPTLTVTAGALATLHVTPASATLTAFGPGTAFAATAADAAGNTVATTGLTWSSGATGVATIAANGAPTAISNGTSTITATLGAVSSTATLTVRQVVGTLTKQAGDGQSATVSTGVTTAPAVRATDANGNPVTGATIQFAIATGSGTVAGGASQTVTTGADGIATAGSWVLGAITGANTLTASTTGAATVTFTASGGAALALSVTSVERLPNGTQQFAIASGPAGPYTWSVAGVDGGNTTVGTVSSTGLYTAPASVPSPNAVQVCARVGPGATQRGCATVTIAATPSAGGDVVVLNDMNVVSSASLSGLEQSNGTNVHPENVQFVTNLISFTGVAPRASQTRALFYLGAGSQCALANFPCDPSSSTSSLARLASVWAGLGYTSSTTTSLATIPSDVKLVYILRPEQSLTRDEINALKQFATEGGRIVVQGEWVNSYTQTGVNAENALLTALGSQLQNVPTTAMTTNGGSYATSIIPHQLMTGVAQLWFNASGTMSVGTNDFILIRALTGETILGVTKVDPTPIP